jgi:hypothetical protein
MSSQKTDHTRFISEHRYRLSWQEILIMFLLFREKSGVIHISIEFVQAERFVDNIHDVTEECHLLEYRNQVRTFTPQANYTDRAAAS